MERFAQLQEKARLRTGQSFRIIVVQEAGLDGFWIHRALQNEDIESHVVDAASIATSRRRRRAKTDKIDGETFRPEFQPPWTGQQQVSVLALNRLDRRDRTALVRQIAGGEQLADEVITQIVGTVSPASPARRAEPGFKSGTALMQQHAEAIDAALQGLHILHNNAGGFDPGGQHGGASPSLPKPSICFWRTAPLRGSPNLLSPRKQGFISREPSFTRHDAREAQHAAGEWEGLSAPLFGVLPD